MSRFEKGGVDCIQREITLRFEMVIGMARYRQGPQYKAQVSWIGTDVANRIEEAQVEYPFMAFRADQMQTADTRQRIEKMTTEHTVHPREITFS